MGPQLRWAQCEPATRLTVFRPCSYGSDSASEETDGPVGCRDQLEAALETIQRICGSFTSPATGIAFTLPVSRVIGLAPSLLEEGHEA